MKWANLFSISTSTLYETNTSAKRLFEYYFLYHGHVYELMSRLSLVWSAATTIQELGDLLSCTKQNKILGNMYSHNYFIVGQDTSEVIANDHLYPILLPISGVTFLFQLHHSL
jgi:hypothetical protein